MAGRKLVRDLHLYRQPLFLHLTSQQQVSSGRVRLISSNGYLGNRRFSVFNEFSKQFKGEATKNHEFQQSVKELKEKAEELKGVKEDLKVRALPSGGSEMVKWRMQNEADKSFSLPDFLAEVQDAVKPVLNAYIKGDLETLKKYCSREVIERCKAEHDGFKSHGIFFDHKILHISEAEIKETKMMGHSPIIIVMFQTQQVYCVRDRNGDVTEGGKDTIHTVYYAWAMQQVDLEELSEGAIYPIWKVREMQQFGVQALI
ncbi:hypothetical protein C1H46_032167 [Malus baccata]|uniref:Tim44-like domain-containing protein n=1 Tax=Malus baccata TaxID=106549 RepID=A0A540L711_MALBA|nr:hypothetical protein C1H46_032167 [Malus baccata]